MESGAILIYLADKTGKLLPKSGEARYRTIEWLMWQMGGPGPMFGQVHHFVKYNPGKAPYAEERYLKEAHRLYGVLDKRLQRPRIRRRRLFHRRHRDMAVGFALRMADRRSQPVSERQALVHGNRQAPGDAEGLQSAERRRRSTDAVRAYMARYFVYILASRPKGVLYVGVTNDLARRIWEHRTKIVPGFTSKYGVTRLVYSEEYASILEARARERTLKHWRREWKFKLIEDVNPTWRDLYDELILL